jgi:hypothetical protein
MKKTNALVVVSPITRLSKKNHIRREKILRKGQERRTVLGYGCLLVVVAVVIFSSLLSPPLPLTTDRCVVSLL